MCLENSPNVSFANQRRDRTFVAWNRLDDALQWPGDLPRGQCRDMFKTLEASTWGISVHLRLCSER